MQKFPANMHDKLGYYVYRLIDPRDGSTFYIGKGSGNRVFDHAQGALQHDDGAEDDRISGSVKRVRQIRSVGLDPIHVVHRHGMSEGEAIHVEAALIDAIPGLENVVAGHGSNDYGPANVNQLVKRYAAPELKFESHDKVMVIKIKQTTVEKHGSVYEAVRRSWKVNKDRADKAQYVLAIMDGICEGVFVPDAWKKSSEPGRYEFTGSESEEQVTKQFVGRCLPKSMRKKGMASPFLYVNI